MILSYHKQPIQAVFFDRDGTLIKDEVYLSDPRKVTLLESVSDVLSELRKSGVFCFVLSNQSGVSRGYMWTSDVFAVNARLDHLLWQTGQAVIHRYFLCFHRPEEKCSCRKPSPELLNQGCQLYGLNPKQCWMIGDSSTDIEAGQKSGMNTYYLGGDHGQATGAGSSLKDWLMFITQDADK